MTTNYIISKNLRNNTEINTSVSLEDNKFILFTTTKRYNCLATTVSLCKYDKGMICYSSDDYSKTLVKEQGKALKSKLIKMHLQGLEKLEEIKKEIQEYYDKPILRQG